MHIQNGATATLSGPATGPIAQTFTWKLAASVDAGGVVSRHDLRARAPSRSTTSQGGRTEHFQTTADVAGNFAVTLPDARLGDVVRIAAAEPATHQMTTTTSTAVGALARASPG